MSAQKTIYQAERSAVLALELRAVLSKLKRRMREQRDQIDLSPSQVAVLLRLENSGPASVSSLARAEGIRHQSMSAIVGSLHDAGLVRSSPDPDDRRQLSISLSKKSEKLLREVRTAMVDWLTTTIQNKLSSQEQQSLAAAVGLLARLVED